MNTFEKDKTYIADTYARYPLEIIGGKGSIAIGKDKKEYNEPVQIDGKSTITAGKNPLLKSYSYIAYDRYPDDYKFIGDLRYVDWIMLDPELEIPIHFAREVYIDCLN